uniref:Uroporphyrinogen decarboxylase n=1 Tax=Candidatus Kentrum sp. LPFa TaxID=2126335 RepID=A0A450XGV1_9GAMM|nr:MAG: uroporphyrinogen decarboxylase [Candidatus Kentron sp. LPFa]VFK28527.1 MAG: uroporphyrinogen decarboxylase [Candidatus Kentron sp. LPFa]
MTEKMTSLQRVLTTLGFQEPDRAPLFLLLTMQGAKELGLTIEEYFSRADHVVEGQLLMLEKYQHDCLYPFFYAGIELEAWGADIIYSLDGPPNCGPPIISAENIQTIAPPKAAEAPCLQKVYETISRLKAEVVDKAPIIGVVMSPFSVPVMQMGFERYLDLLYEKPDLFEILMAKNEAFCVEYANTQISAGATAICYFDPLASPTIIPPGLYEKTGNQVAKRTISQIKGPTATHLASGRTAAVIDLIAGTGTAVLGFSVDEDPALIKRKSNGRLSLLGNLNGIAMRNWTPEIAEQVVKETIAAGAAGGGFILSDTHGEIPYQVPEEILLAISRAVARWGTYPLDWITRDVE